MAENRIPKIELSAEEVDRLKVRLDRMIGEAKEFRGESQWDELHEQYWKQFLCVPKFKVRTSPWEGASNIYIPMTQVSINAILSNEFDAMLSNDPVVKVITTRPSSDENISQFESDSKALSDYWDWFYREVVNLRQLGADWLLDNCVDGTSAVKARLNRDTIVRRQQRQIERMGKDPLGPNDVVTVEDAFIERTDEISNDVSDMSGLYFAPGSYVSPDKPLQFAYPYCPWYYQLQQLTLDDLNERRRGGYDVDDDLLAFLVESQISPKDGVIREKEGTSNTVVRTLAVVEMYMRWPLPARYQKQYDANDEQIEQKEGDEKGYAEEVIVTYATSARRILRMVPLYRIYPDGKRPHVPMYYQKFPRYIYGQGVASRLKNLNSAANTIFNQSIDYGSISVAPWGFYNPGTMGIMPDLVGINPGSLIPTPDPKGANFPRTNFDLSAHQVWGSTINAWGDKVSQVTEAAQGRNSSTPNATRTKGGILALIQQSNIPFSVLVSQHAESFIELARRNNELKRKYARVDTPFRKLNKERGMYENQTINRRAFEIESDFQFVLNPNRMQEYQQNQAIFGITMDAIGRAIQSPQVADMIRSNLAEVYESAGKKNFDRMWPKDAITVPPAPPAAPQPGPGMPPGVQAPGGPPPGPPAGMPMGQAPGMMGGPMGMAQSQGMPAGMPPPMMPPPTALPEPLAPQMPEPNIVTPEEENVVI